MCGGIGRGMRIEGVILDADCGLVDKNDLQCNVDNNIVCVRVQKTNVVKLLKWFALL